MADIKLFRVGEKVEEVKSSAVELEKKLQTLIEKNMDKFFNVRFLASEYAIPEGRMDSLGIDENFAPVIFEYKRSKDENVMSQGLFYLAWLMDHRDSFVVLVQEKLGKRIAKDDIAWDGARVVCVANDFTKYDQGAIKQMNANISLYRYRMFGSDLFYLDRVDENDITSTRKEKGERTGPSAQVSFEDKLTSVPDSIKELYGTVENFIMSFGDDIKGFSRDVTKIGHYGTGNVQLRLHNVADYEKAKPFLRQAYDEN